MPLDMLGSRLHAGVEDVPAVAVAGAYGRLGS